jgi:protein-tyrosine kinase
MSKIYSLALRKALQEGNRETALDGKVADLLLGEQATNNDSLNAQRQTMGRAEAKVADGNKATKRHGRIDERLVALHNTNIAAIEQYRKLSIEIIRAERVRGLRTLLISSALEHEGKSLTALNLAIVMASQRGGKSALLVETDFRRPSVHQLLGTHPESGLSDYLLGDVTYEQIFVQTSIPGLTVVHAGQWLENPMMILHSEKMEQFFQQVKSQSQYSFIILDTSPIILTSEPTALMPYVDATVLVVHAKKTPREMVAQAIEILGEENILGCVFNGITSSDTRNYHYYYRTDYYQSGGNTPR